jgi:hypothetical protein
MGLPLPWYVIPLYSYFIYLPASDTKMKGQAQELIFVSLVYAKGPADTVISRGKNAALYPLTAGNKKYKDRYPIKR